MADILEFDGITFVPTEPEEVLEKAKDWGMNRCTIIGFNDDNELRFGGSFSDAGEILLLLELAKKFVIDNEFGRIP